MGEVYRATDTVLKRQVALKVLPDALAADAERLARLQREAEVLASLNHPNIAILYGFERSNGTSALVMELVDGPTLADRIAEGPIPAAEVLTITRQIAEGLEAAHEQGVVHRDLKPVNIKVRSDGTVKLLDFGLAKLVESSGDNGAAAWSGTSESKTVAWNANATMTQTGMILGTAAYMAPEHAKGKAADRQSDIWAFGVIVAEMATGQRLFDGPTPAETIATVLTREPDLDGVPSSLRRLVQLCLARDPRARLRHIGDALALVDDSPRGQGPQVASGARSRSAVIALCALFAAAAAVIAWAWLRPRRVDEAVTRFYVDAPPHSAFNYTYTATAVSPDGSAIVFRVATETEAPSLWLRPLDALEGRRLAGTDGADFPFWSPDGHDVAFFSAGRLKRVDTRGGTPIVICDASHADATTTGGSWNRAGDIIFGAPQGLYRVSAAGGAPALFAPVNNVSGETGYGNPQFLPDGDRFVMFVRTEDAKQTGYYVSSLSQPQRKTRLLETKSQATFVANEGGDQSYLLYLQDRTLLARRVDLRTLALNGEPVPVASDVARFPPGFHGSFWSSASGNLLAYRTEASDRPRLTWLYPDGKRQPIGGTEDFYTHLRLSPDGSHAAVELADASGNLDVWTWDLARQVKTRQTFDPKPDRAATWSPNGREIAFSSLRTGVWQIYRKNLTTGQPEEQLTSGPDPKIFPEWSRDGRFLLFIQIAATTSEDIWALPLEGDRQPFPVLQTPAMDTNPALSPDGRWLAYESSQSGRPEVYVTRFPTSRNALPAAAPRWQVSTQGGSRPRWDVDGRALFYVSLEESSILRAAVRPSDAGFESDAPKVFGQIPVMPVARAPFDVSSDGRVLVLERTINRGAPLALVTNSRRIATGR
jgi:Tol biopolymer transport system component